MKLLTSSKRNNDVCEQFLSEITLESLSDVNLKITKNNPQNKFQFLLVLGSSKGFVGIWEFYGWVHKNCLRMFLYPVIFCYIFGITWENRAMGPEDMHWKALRFSSEIFGACSTAEKLKFLLPHILHFFWSMKYFENFQSVNKRFDWFIEHFERDLIQLQNAAGFAVFHNPLIIFQFWSILIIFWKGLKNDGNIPKEFFLENSYPFQWRPQDFFSVIVERSGHHLLNGFRERQRSQDVNEV